MQVIKRSNVHELRQAAEAAGSYDEWPLLPPDVDPQARLSCNTVDQPFFAGFDHDTCLAQLTGEATVEFIDSRYLATALSPGDWLYLPAGIHHRVVPQKPALQLRYVGREAHWEEAVFLCGCGERRSSHSWNTGVTLPQEGFSTAVAQHDSLALEGVLCSRCGTTVEAIGTQFRWDEIAAWLRADAHEQLEGLSASRLTAMPRPDPARHPRKGNVLWSGHLMNSQSAPLFPELGPGSMVPCVAMAYGRPRPFTGRFIHENSVDEVILTLAASGTTAAPGTLRVGPRRHVVENRLGDVHDPERFTVIVITQRQDPSGIQRESVTLLCDSCESALHAVDVEFSPPTTAPIPGFDTILIAERAAREFNSDETLRRCDGCGATNAPFDVDHFGWDRYAERLRVANEAARQLAATGTITDQLNQGRLDAQAADHRR